MQACLCGRTHVLIKTWHAAAQRAAIVCKGGAICAEQRDVHNQKSHWASQAVVVVGMLAEYARSGEMGVGV